MPSPLFIMNKVDFSHENIPNPVPQGFDFWESHWKLEEKIVNGKKVSFINKNKAAVVAAHPVEAPVTSGMDLSEKGGETFFKCDKCDYTSAKKQGIVMHIRKKHKDS